MTSLFRLSARVVVAWAVLGGGVVQVGAEPDAGARIAPGLEQALANAAPQDWLAIGVTLREGDLPGVAGQAGGPRAGVAARQQGVLDALPGGAFRLGRRYQVLAGLAGRARPEAVEALARHPDVLSVYVDGRVRASLAQGVPQVGADDAHALGLTGAGINVAVLDTGIDGDHPDLADDLVAERCYCSGHPSPMFGCCPNGQDTQSGPGSAEDDDGHGTSVSGIVSSGGAAAPLGVAPDAGVVAIRVLGPTGGAFSDIAAGLDWVLANRNAFADPIRAVNLSLGDGVQYSSSASSPCSGSNTANAIAALSSADVAVFAASGNEGFEAGVSFPACVAGAISVGAVYDGSFALLSWCANASCSEILCTDTNTAPDDFACFSNSGAILDLLAPSFRARTSGLAGGVQTSFSGTSAASPYAAGQAALLLEADAGLSPGEIRALLAASGPLVTNPESGLSFHRADVGEIAPGLVAECGNGVLEPGEQCDDGGTAAGDCCAPDCSFEPSGSLCDEGDACTTGDSCDGAGACQGGPPLDCDDANACTDDACDPELGCVSIPNTAACDDGDACTTGDTCSDGTCQGGPPPDCDDANACTDDACDPELGCLATPNTAACDDGDACTTDDACSGGTCQGGPPPDCDDGDPCTAESCDAIEGCVSTPVEGCSAPIPAFPRPLVPLLAVLLAATGARWAARRAPVE